jgi:hypothetical protein
MDFAEWCENWTRIVPKPMPRGTLFGQFADLHQNYNSNAKKAGSDNDDGSDLDEYEQGEAEKKAEKQGKGGEMEVEFN